MKIIYILVSLSLFLGCSKETDSVKETTLSEGEQIVKQNCKVCHAQGINGAPVIGNKKMWQERTGKGLDALANNAINGFGLMPAKGGRTELADEEVILAVKYMLSQLEN